MDIARTSIYVVGLFPTHIYRGDGAVSLQLEMDRRSAKVGTTAKKYFVNSRFGPISCQNQLTAFPVADLRGFPSRAGFP